MRIKPIPILVLLAERYSPCVRLRWRREGLGITTEGLKISFEDREHTIRRYSERTGI
jgi:hypothetical protein